jgi:CMP-N-acetylneuraminic acid synthetase
MIHNRKVTALIPIKEHSERVKNKNFKLFTGKPLYHHILETLEHTYAVDEVIINTDSLVVKNEASELFPKVKIHMRPEDLQGRFYECQQHHCL